MTKPDILIIWPNMARQMAMLDEEFICHHLYNAEDPRALLAEVGGRIRGVVASGEKGASRALIEQLPNLEIVSVFGVGVDATDLVACTERGVIVTNTPDVLTEDVADMGLMLVLGCLRQVLDGDEWARNGLWEHQGPMPLTRSARGRKLGILGLGRIGRALARRAQAIGMTIAYCGRTRQADTEFEYFGSLEELARAVDVLALCCPGGDATRGLVSKEVLEALGPDGFLINIARGSVVDEPALIEALQQKKIAGAGLDVFVNEPVVPEGLCVLENVLLQPHAASATFETRDAMAQLMFDNIRAHFDGKPVLTRVV